MGSNYRATLAVVFGISVGIVAFCLVLLFNPWGQKADSGSGCAAIYFTTTDEQTEVKVAVLGDRKISDSSCFQIASAKGKSGGSPNAVHVTIGGPEPGIFQQIVDYIGKPFQESLTATVPAGRHVLIVPRHIADMGSDGVIVFCTKHNYSLQIKPKNFEGNPLRLKFLRESFDFPERRLSPGQAARFVRSTTLY